MNNSTNINNDDLASCRYAVSIFLSTAMAIISSAAFIGNILVLVAVYRTPKLRNSTNHYYVNMAVSDSLASLATWLLYFTEEMITRNGSLPQGPLPNVSCKMGLYFRLGSYIVSSLSLVLIAVDRFIATVFPLKAALITPKVRAALLFATWLIPLAHLLYYSRFKEDGPETFCNSGWNYSLAMVIYYITSVAIYNFAPLIVIIVIYSRIMHALKTRQQTELNDANVTNSQQRKSKQTQSVMQIFKSVVIAYFVCIFLVGIYLVLVMTLQNQHTGAIKRS
ncbi:RYamide receptor-like [Oculina patagonica]